MRTVVGLVVAAIAIGTLACSSNNSNGQNDVFFVGYVYDGATGAQLPKSVISDVSISYRDKQIKVDIDDSGQFVSRDPLPTWQDYVVTIDANGYRSFVSYNTGIDLPASLANTSGAAQASTTQTLDFAAYLFPTSLQSPQLTLTVTAPDPVTGLPSSSAINGSLRLRPLGLPNIEIGAGGTTVMPANRVWANDNDLLNQTVVKPIVAGSVVVAAGELVYGVAYEVTIYDVPGYQPLVASESTIGTTTSALVAGAVTSRTFTLTPEMQDPLQIIATNSLTCAPPSGTDTNYDAQVILTFNTAIEVVGTSYAEQVDTGLSITEPNPPSSTSVNYYCPLKAATGDPTMPRGTQVQVSGATLTFSFNPSVGLATTYYGTTCTPPPLITSVTYGGISSMLLQPVGDPSRRRLLTDMLYARGASQITCPSTTGF